MTMWSPELGPAPSSLCAWLLGTRLMERGGGHGPAAGQAPGASGTLTLWSSVAGQRFVRSLPGLEEFQSTISVAAQTPLHFPWDESDSAMLK